jgi:two-component system, cell cycle sensor histidine kinase and response regulator CckA
VDAALPVEIFSPGPPKRIFAARIRQVPRHTPGGSPDSGGRQWVLTISDITQERENQAHTQEQERLATMGQFAAGIAHDFNNIMATILIYADLMYSDPALPRDMRDKMSTIQQQVQRAASLIRQILDFSRMAVMDQMKLDLLPLVKELDKMLARLLPETIRLEFSYRPGEYWVSGDPARLQQIFMNLALNARDAMPDGGVLHIELDRLEVVADRARSPGDPAHLEEMAPGEWIRARVSDTGVGIPPENLEHIFEPFFTTKPVGRGTGLGLAQVYGIIRQHNGFIEAHSQIEQGAAFSIYLPALPVGQVEAPRPAETAPLKGHGAKILIVEDETAVREALQAFMELQGFNTALATNGHEALDYIQAVDGKLDLVISDVVMPGMGGLELYRRVRQAYPAIRMLLMSGYPLEEESRQGIEQGNLFWLQKPFSVQSLNQAVQRLL